MKTKSKKRGGARLGAGRKQTDRGLKKTTTIRLYEDQITKVNAHFGSLQKAVDSWIEAL